MVSNLVVIVVIVLKLRIVVVLFNTVTLGNLPPQLHLSQTDASGFKLDHLEYRIRLNVLGPQKRKKRAWVWAHGVDVLDTKDDNLWLCKYCYQQKKKIKTYISTATNHVVEHLFKNHRINEIGLVEMKANEDIGELLQRQKKQRMPLLIGAHSGENIAGLVKNVIKDYRVG
ncbi:hypothetical protein B0A49_12144, partial [Cryomyces minteri]